MSKTEVNWGILGCAWIADERTIPGMLSADNANLYAISGRSAERREYFRKKFNPEKSYESYAELLDDPDIDAVYVPLPNGLHAEWAIKAAEKKKHVLCEKPLAMNTAEVEQISDACSRNGVMFMEAFASRHSPVLIEAKRILDSGRIGDLRFVEAHFCFNLQDKENVRYNRELGGGATYDAGAYTLGTIRHLVGREPVKVLSMGEIDGETDVDVKCCALLDFGDGVMASSYCAFNSNFWSGYNIIGTLGRIDAAVDYNGSGRLEIAVTMGDDDREVIEVDVPDNYMLEIEQFGRCILDGETPRVSYEDSLGNARVTDEILKQLYS